MDAAHALGQAGRWRLQGALVAYLRVQASLGEVLQVPEVRRDLYHLVEQDFLSEIKSIGEPTTLSARMSFEVTVLSRTLPSCVSLLPAAACDRAPLGSSRRVKCHKGLRL